MPTPFLAIEIASNGHDRMQVAKLRQPTEQILARSMRYYGDYSNKKRGMREKSIAVADAKDGAGETDTAFRKKPVQSSVEVCRITPVLNACTISLMIAIFFFDNCARKGVYFCYVWFVCGRIKDGKAGKR